MIVTCARASEAGSSPLTRGKPTSASRQTSSEGLIPAHAGKTRVAIYNVTTTGAHPRSRGENHRQPPHHTSPRGLIPAHAGKTPPASGSNEVIGAHPRSRGENLTSWSHPSAIRGSSPLTRGKHFLTYAFIAQIGQILETLELAVSSGNYSLCDVYATDAPQDQARTTGLSLPCSRAAS